MTPILLPIVQQIGMHPVSFGILISVNLAIGFVTPPYGVNLFVASSISGVSIEAMMKYMWYFILALLIVLSLITYIPILTTFTL